MRARPIISEKGPLCHCHTSITRGLASIEKCLAMHDARLWLRLETTAECLCFWARFTGDLAKLAEAEAMRAVEEEKKALQARPLPSIHSLMRARCMLWYLSGGC